MTEIATTTFELLGLGALRRWAEAVADAADGLDHGGVIAELASQATDGDLDDVGLMHGPAAVRLLEYVPATAWLGRALRRLRLTALLTGANRILGRVRKPLAPYFPDQRRPRRWP